MRDHYEFTGWYKDREGKEAFDPAAETISEELILYAGWKAVTYSIIYEMNGVEKPAENPESYTTEDTIILKIRSGKAMSLPAGPERVLPRR